MDSEQLVRLYTDILKETDPAFLSPQSEVRPKGLAQIFLPSVLDGYAHATNKIMIVGRETKGWSRVKSLGLNTEEYVQESVQQHKIFLNQQLTLRKRVKGASFLNFMRDVATTVGSAGIVHANLFCFSFHKSHPASSPEFRIIKQISKQILDAQIQLLQPNIIIFANGSSSWQERQEYFPIKGDARVCTNFRYFKKQGLTDAQLWGFTLYGKTPCYRIHHPSNFSTAARQARTFLLKHLHELEQLSDEYVCG